ncbi:hypothetical protein [Paraflavitalea pollutisoli]|uniref:hypothetical protein n=1 Tax=Paraflavitalea pollutisoli TaxID=3034143 RepID=UPI0023ED3C62|nr:hypothetical protein [Paraflavitalea sp. H1-2-19X]
MNKMLWAFSLLMICIAVACKKDTAPVDPTDPGGGPNPTPNPPIELPEGEKCKPGTIIPGTLLQKEIGTGGGEFVLGNVKFIFPAGAVDKPATFKIQRLLNTAPNGIDSMAFRFETATDVVVKKPVKMIYTFPRDADGNPFIPGGSPKVLGGVAIHKVPQGQTEGIYEKVPGMPTINEAAGTATQDFPLPISNGKLDIVNFLQYKLWIGGHDGSKISSTTVVCDDQVNYWVTKVGDPEHEPSGEIFVPIPKEEPVDGKKKSYITEIYINGKAHGTTGLYGHIRSNNKDNFFCYEAPRVVPGGPEKTAVGFSIAVDIMTIKNDVSKYYLVSGVKLINESSISIKGRIVKNLRHDALEEQGWRHIGINLNSMDHPGTRTSVALTINHIFYGVGKFELKYPEQSDVSASASDGEASYGMSAPIPGSNGRHEYANGTINITYCNRGEGIIKGDYTLSLVRTFNGKVERVPVSGKFTIPLVVAN